jgi:hypothetical protein
LDAKLGNLTQKIEKKNKEMKLQLRHMLSHVHNAYAAAVVTSGEATYGSRSSRRVPAKKKTIKDTLVYFFRVGQDRKNDKKPFGCSFIHALLRASFCRILPWVPDGPDV